MYNSLYLLPIKSLHILNSSSLDYLSQIYFDEFLLNISNLISNVNIIIPLFASSVNCICPLMFIYLYKYVYFIYTFLYFLSVYPTSLFSKFIPLNFVFLHFKLFSQVRIYLLSSMYHFITQAKYNFTHHLLTQSSQ